jgi:hypothetical protein
MVINRIPRIMTAADVMNPSQRASVAVKPYKME